MADLQELLGALNAINPSMLDYMEWESVGAALHYAGADVSAWDSWSARDASRYHKGECERKWKTFRGSDNPVTEATIYKMAYDAGWQKPKANGEHRAYSWTDAVRITDAEYPKPTVKPVTQATVSVKDVGEDIVLDGAPESWREGLG